MTAAAPARRLLDLWACWWVFPPFYTVFGIIFVPLTRVMPPPSPGKTTAQIEVFFHAHALTIQVGFAILMLAIGCGSIVNGLVAYQMRRMTVNPAFSYAYIGTLAVGALPGGLFVGLCFLAATLRPDRDPHLVAMLYDLGLLSFVGSLGCFATQYLIFAIAIFLDRNKIFPLWLAYVSIWQIVTELIAGPVFIFYGGPFAWNGSISFWEGTVIFCVYLTALIMLVRKAVERQQPGEGIPG